MVAVARVGGSHRLVGEDRLVEFANRWLAHLEAGQFASGTIRGYAFDLLCLARFFDHAGIDWRTAGPTDFFDWLEWQSRPAPSNGQRAVSLAAKRGAAPATMNRRIAADRGLFEYAVMCDVLDRNPVPAPRRSSGLRGARRGLLGHVRGRRAGVPARLVRQERRLPESLDADDVAEFLADLDTHRDRAIVLLMLLGGLRAAEARSLRLTDVDVGLRQVKVTGKGSKQRVVPVDRAFFSEVTAYLRVERPQGLSTPECFVVLRGSTTGQAMTEAGLRRIFRTHRARSGATRVRPHRLRHTFGTELASGRTWSGCAPSRTPPFVGGEYSHGRQLYRIGGEGDPCAMARSSRSKVLSWSPVPTSSRTSIRSCPRRSTLTAATRVCRCRCGPAVSC